MISSRATTRKPDLPSLVGQYFCEYLIKQRNASPETIASYRDAFRLFLRFSEQRFGKTPDALTLADFDAPEVLAFLDERPEEFVCRRHRALQAEGLSNSEIFVRLAAELERWRFRAPAYSERQIRRMIYG